MKIYRLLITNLADHFHRFVKFLDCFYFTLIMQKKEVGCIGGNYIYAIKSTEIFPIRKRDEPVEYFDISTWNQ